MTAATGTASTPPRRVGRSIAAVFLGFIAVVILSLGTDQLLHVLNVYPPWGQTMYDARLNALALSYRIVYTVLGGYITAAFAPSSPMRHVWVLGTIGFLAGVAGVIAAIPLNLGPIWYPVAIAVTALPSTWLGGALYLSRHADR